MVRIHVAGRDYNSINEAKAHGGLTHRAKIALRESGAFAHQNKYAPSGKGQVRDEDYVDPAKDVLDVLSMR